MKGNHLTNVLLAVIAVLLLLNQFDVHAARAQANEASVVGPEEPTVIGISVSQIGTGGGTQFLFRLWSDGGVDVMRTSIALADCSTDVLCVGSVLDRCIGDLDYDREVAFTDLLTVLSAWGPCPQ